MTIGRLVWSVLGCADQGVVQCCCYRAPREMEAAAALLMVHVATCSMGTELQAMVGVGWCRCGRNRMVCRVHCTALHTVCVSILCAMVGCTFVLAFCIDV
jgi:hypothetical protein